MARPRSPRKPSRANSPPRSRIVTPPNLKSIPRLKGYKFEASPVGAGNYGEVWIAQRTTIDQRRAVKILHEFISRDIAIDEAKKQVDIISKNVVRVFDVDHARVNGKKRVAIVMEYCPQTLATFFSNNRTGRKGVHYKKALPILSQILEGIDIIHGTVVHGDLKPINVLMNDKGIPKIADFGAARHFLETFLFVRGSSNWMAPEAINQGDLSKESDYFSYGAIAYWMLSGRHPFYRPDPSCLSSEGDNILDPHFRVAMLDGLCKGQSVPKKVSRAIMALLDRSRRAQKRRAAGFELLRQAWYPLSKPPRSARRGRSKPPPAGPKAVRGGPSRGPAPRAVALPTATEQAKIDTAYALARRVYFVERDPDGAIKVLVNLLGTLGWERFKGSGSRALADCLSLLAFIHNGRVYGTSYKQAEDAAKWGIEVDPNHAESYQTRGWARLKQDNADGAVSDFRKALSLTGDATKAAQIRRLLETAESLLATAEKR